MEREIRNDPNQDNIGNRNQDVSRKNIESDAQQDQWNQSSRQTDRGESPFSKEGAKENKSVDFDDEEDQ